MSALVFFRFEKFIRLIYEQTQIKWTANEDFNMFTFFDIFSFWVVFVQMVLWYGLALHFEWTRVHSFAAVLVVLFLFHLKCSSTKIIKLEHSNTTPYNSFCVKKVTKWNYPLVNWNVYYNTYIRNLRFIKYTNLACNVYASMSTLSIIIIR